MKTDNELIAEFFGAVYRSGPNQFNPDRTIVQWIIDGNPFNQHRDKGVKHWYSPEQLMYHQSWDWLMPVVEKIWKSGKMVNINFYDQEGLVETVIYNWGVGEPQQRGEVNHANPIESVYKAVVAHIKWCNAQKV